MSNDFFKEQSANSEVKMQIVLTAFKEWLKDATNAPSLSYIDLFAGPGIYDDGTFSTPICVLQEICARRQTAQKFNVILNDKDAESVAKLRRAIGNIRNAKYLKTLTTSNDDASTAIDLPNDGYNFVFLDPWGWKGMNRNYIRNMLTNPNCEIALLFSFNQFHRFMNFDKIDGLFDDLFDNETLQAIRNFCAMNPGYKNEQFILETFTKSLTDDFTECHIVPFKFKIEISLKTSHYIVFIVRDGVRAERLSQKLRSFSNYRDDMPCYFSKNDGPDAPPDLFKHCE